MTSEYAYTPNMNKKKQQTSNMIKIKLLDVDTDNTYIIDVFEKDALRASNGKNNINLHYFYTFVLYM